MERSANFTVYRSSAGSGKTYTLVRSYLGIALKRPDDFRNILAITFTNKAANEMKSRVIDYLVALANPKEHPDSVAVKHLLPELVRDTRLDAGQIRERSEYLLKKLFHDYADFSISTIDSFMHRVVRSFAFDLHRPIDFEVTLEQDRLLEEVAELLVSRAGSDEAITRALVELVEKKAEDDRSWDIGKDLQETGKVLFSEDGIEVMPLLKMLKIPEYLEARQRIRTFRAIFKQKIIDAATSALKAIAAENLLCRHFYQSTRGIYAFFERLSGANLENVRPNTYASKSYHENAWASQHLSPAELAAIERIVPELKKAYESIAALVEEDYGRYILFGLLENNLMVTALIGEMEKELEAIKAERKLMPISEFNRLIHAIVRQQPAPFIYERLGERYHHYLVDEFQDTSVVQWHNLLPLVENALAGGYLNLVVGDGKQAIYRWRSGDVEQFRLLPKVIGSGQDMILRQREATLARNYSSETLARNFRSSREIVDFNNRFYEYVRSFIPELQRSIYEDVRQESNHQPGGLVSIEFIEGSRKKEEFRQLVLDRLSALVEEILADGYRLSDITMLFRKVKEASEAAAMLVSAGFRVISSESLLLKCSPEVNFLLQWFRIMSDPADQVSLGGILTFLVQASDHEAARLDEQLEVFRKTRLATNSVPDAHELLDPILASRSGGLDIHALKSLDLVSMTEALIRIFGLNAQANPYLQFFQDAVLGFSGNSLAQAADFLDWWELKSEDLSIVVPEGLDAIRIMTIHKAKGLEFPVVVIPMADEKHDLTYKSRWIRLSSREIPPVEAVYLPLLKSLEETEYSDIRQVELDKSYLDMVNLMYVATTRPEGRLYIMAPAVSKIKESPGSFNELLAGFLEQQGLWTGEGQRVVFGKPGKSLLALPEKVLAGMTLPSYISSEWRPKVRLRLQASRGWDFEHPENNREWGNLLHSAMASIRGAGDVETVLVSLQEQGLIREAMKGKIAAIIRKIMEMPETALFFEEGQEIYNEQEIIDKKGKLYRPDRLMIRGKEAMIIDYKTGAEHPGYELQLRNYASLMTEMGYAVKGAWLLYMGEDPRLVQVG